MRLYAGCDLHSSNTYLGIRDENGKRVFEKKLANDPEVIVNILKQFKNEIAGIVVESTYNGYWLVDLLMAEGYSVHLANTDNNILKLTASKSKDVG
jgi:transposase